MPLSKRKAAVAARREPDSDSDSDDDQRTPLPPPPPKSKTAHAAEKRARVRARPDSDDEEDANGDDGGRIDTSIYGDICSGDDSEGDDSEGDDKDDNDEDEDEDEDEEEEEGEEAEEDNEEEEDEDEDEEAVAPAAAPAAAPAPAAPTAPTAPVPVAEDVASAVALSGVGSRVSRASTKTTTTSALRGALRQFERGATHVPLFRDCVLAPRVSVGAPPCAWRRLLGTDDFEATCLAHVVVNVHASCFAAPPGDEAENERRPAGGAPRTLAQIGSGGGLGAAGTAATPEQQHALAVLKLLRTLLLEPEEQAQAAGRGKAPASSARSKKSPPPLGLFGETFNDPKSGKLVPKASAYVEELYAARDLLVCGVRVHVLVHAPDVSLQARLATLMTETSRLHNASGSTSPLLLTNNAALLALYRKYDAPSGAFKGRWARLLNHDILALSVAHHVKDTEALLAAEALRPWESMAGTHAHPLAAECVLTARRSEALKAGLPPGELASAQAVAVGYNVTATICDESTQCYSSKYRFRQVRAPNAAAFYGVPHGTSPMHAQLPLELLNKIAAYNTSRTAAAARATGSLMSDSE